MNQDWNEVEALHASLREHMAEIKRLNDCLTWEQHRAAHIGTHSPGCEEWGPKHYECLLRAHKDLKARIKRNADPGKTFDQTADDTPEQRMLRKKWFGGRLYGHLPFLEAVDETMKSLHAELDEALGTWKMLDEDTCKTSDHIPDAGKMVDQSEESLEMVASCQESRQVEPVQEPFGYLWPTGRHPEFRFTQQRRDGVDGMPLYTAPPQRKPLTAPQIHELDWPDGVAFGEILEFTRAIERAHGIGGEE